MTDGWQAELAQIAEREKRDEQVLERFISRADQAFAACGLEPPRRPLSGESSVGFVASVMDQFGRFLRKEENKEWAPQHWVECWAGDSSGLIKPGSTLQSAAALGEKILKDSLFYEDSVTRRPVAGFQAPVGPLRSVVTRDDTDRKIRRWYGADDALWRYYTNEFTQGRFDAETGKYVAGQYVGPKTVRINTDLGTGKNSYEAREQRGRELARADRAEQALRREEAATVNNGASG